MKSIKFGQYFTCFKCQGKIYDSIIPDQYGRTWCQSCVDVETAIAERTMGLEDEAISFWDNVPKKSYNELTEASSSQTSTHETISIELESTQTQC